MNPLTNLFYRYLNNQCSPEEVKLLLANFNQDEDHEGLKTLIMEQLQSEVPDGFEQQQDVVKVFSKTDQFLQGGLFKHHKNTIIKKMMWFTVAASIVTCVGLGYLFFYGHIPEIISEQGMNGGSDARPGTEKAILTLADGSSVVLNENTSATILKKAGVKIRKTEDGTLVYEAASNAVAGTELVYNKLSTPIGATYKVILPDGTRVWLNAGSSLRYPLAFDAKERRVTLNGEGYFEVEKLNAGLVRIPFYVETAQQVVQVLGTEFNISAYDDDKTVKTTLISGKVNVSARAEHKNEMLSPGEQAVLADGNVFQVIKVNTESAISWKNGNFMFEDVCLKDIMKQLCRWYNVEVDANQIPQTRYNMFISRNETLQRVLTMLGSTGNLKFQLNNNKIKIN